MMVIFEGLNPDEEIKDVAVASFLRGKKSGVVSKEDFVLGKIVLTQKGVVFLATKGILKTTRLRQHAYTYDVIRSVRIETRGVVGSLVGEDFIIIAIQASGRYQELRYSLKRDDCTRLYKILNSYIQLGKAELEVQKAVFKFTKPRVEVSLDEIIRDFNVRKAVTDLIGDHPDFDSLAKQVVINTLQTLITEGQLDGLLTDRKYVSKLSLSQRSIQYQVTIDFASLFSKLKTKGVVLESLECPSCKGKLQYPKSGNIVTCKYCGSNVTAIDLFEKFKSLLEI